MPSIIIGLAAGVFCNYVANWRARTTLDDSLDVFACHGIGGMLGTFDTGLFASAAINAAGPNGLFFGNSGQVVAQLVGIAVVAAFAFVGTYVFLRVINIFTPLRVSSKEEDAGLDLTQHGEEAYEQSEQTALQASLERRYPGFGIAGDDSPARLLSCGQKIVVCT